MTDDNSNTAKSSANSSGNRARELPPFTRMPPGPWSSSTVGSPSFRRNSIATMDTTRVPFHRTNLELMPEYRNIERSPNYEDLAPFTMLATFMNRRNSMTNVETEMKMRYSLQSTNDHKDHKSNVQRLKERFPTSRGNVLASRSSHGRASQRSSVIGSVVEAGTKSDEDISQEVTSGTPGRDSTPVPFTLIHQANERKRKFDLEREHLIESLVNFSCHTPIVLLEDLITHELQLYEGQKEIDRIIEDAKNKEIETTDDESLSSLSSDERGPDEVEMHKSNASIENNLQMPPVPHVRVSSLPTTQERESALLFVDISGFTNLSTMLDVETLSKVINSYFDMIVSEVILHGGDILKFAGDAFFAEWRTVNEEKIPRGREGENALKRLNASILSSSQDISWASLESGGTVSTCVWQAAICAASIVKKFSDFKVTSPLETFKNEHEAMLNVHCGIGAGHMIGLHVGDYREDDDERQEDEAVELRREYLFLGDAIDQVSRAGHIASDGEVMASPQAMKALAACCEIPCKIEVSDSPVCIASRGQLLVSLQPKQAHMLEFLPREDGVHTPVYENLRRHCVHLHRGALSRLHLQMALYVHPVVRGDELVISQRAKTIAPQSRHLAEAELRSVYTMFIKALVSPRTTGRNDIDKVLFKTLGDIMHVTSRELDRYSGQLRQFIVDDKGVVLIATFGLRGSTFPNLVANNALPATFDIHTALKDELGIENRIGATFGKVYCGIVGGVMRHEFAVMGGPVNLAARLMESPMNKGMLVDEAVRAHTDARFAFRSLPPVHAKGYDKPVAILEPLHAISSKRKKGTSFPFTGRQEERNELVGIAKEILDAPTPAQSSAINLIGESGIGKSALGIAVINEVKIECLKRKKRVIVSRSTSTETEQRIPLCAFRKVFLSAIRELCVHDGSIYFRDEKGDAEKGKKMSPVDGHIPSRERASTGTEKSKRRPRMASLQPDQQSSTRRLKVQSLWLQEQRQSLRSVTGGSVLEPAHLRGSGRRISLDRNVNPPPRPSALRASSARDFNQVPEMESGTSSRIIPYLDKLRWACEEVDYPREYAELVGSQFLGLDAANPVTHVNGRVPLVAELVEFVAQAYMHITNFADLILVFIDDFQWVDSFTWKVVRALGQSGRKMLLICAMRSHDKQAMRRMSNGVNSRVEITLGPLYLPDIRELIASVLEYSKSTIDDFLCTEIYQKTGGLPVYVTELLEDLKRNKAVALNEDGILRLTAEGQIQKEGGKNSALVMKESLLNRFDALDVRCRKVLQTAAVLGNSFALSDLFRVHPELQEIEIETSLDIATEEMILFEIVEEEDDNKSAYSNSTGGSESRFGSSIEYSRTSTGWNVIGDRYFQFSHDMWRNNVLTTMLKERKIELHRLIAEAMEKDQAVIFERCDIARLLTLFDHWKSCGDFRKAAPLALAVGNRLNEWDLSAQSLDLYRDALDMCFASVVLVDENHWRSESDWVQVAAEPRVLDLIVRLQIRIAECHRLIGDLEQCASIFNDASAILSSSSGPNRSLMVPIMSGLCDIKLQHEAYDAKTLLEQEELIQKFVKAAQDEGNAVHLSRALSLEAAFFAHNGNFERALQDQQVLQMVYKIEQHSARIVEQYHKDYAAECFSQSILWYYLMGEHDKASRQADLVVERHLPFQDPKDVDNIMSLILPVVLVLKFMGRASEADYIMKKHVINAFHELAPCATYWVETFNPICYLLEIVKMEEEDKFDDQIVEEVGSWVLDEANSYYSPEHLRLGHTLMGEICWRLGNLEDEGEPMRQIYLEKAKCFLTPIARDTLTEPFLAHSALALLKTI